MKYDLHVHSKYSYDSCIDPEKIIKYAKEKGLSGIAVTDHNTIRGGLIAFKNNTDRDFQVIVGEEVKTEYGDITALFINEEIKTRNLEEVLDEIKDQGGLSVLNHPYRHNKDPEKIINQTDLVEGFNARSRLMDNRKALQIAAKYHKPICAGSDVHFYFEIGMGKTIVSGEIEECLRKGLTEIEGKESNYYLVHGLSVSLEIIRSWLK